MKDLSHIFQQTKTYSKSTIKECFINVIRVSLELVWKMFLKSVTEFNFRKSLYSSEGLYIPVKESVTESAFDKVLGHYCKRQ